MYVFSVDISFYGSQSLSKMRSKFTAVSLILLCMSQRCQGHRCSVCRCVRFLHKKQCLGSFNKIGCTLHAQRYHWHRCATNFFEYLREFEDIFEKALTSVSGAQGKLYDEETRGRKSRVRVSLRCNIVRLVPSCLNQQPTLTKMVSQIVSLTCI
jgi:hypothetical protein